MAIDLNPLHMPDDAPAGAAESHADSRSFHGATSRSAEDAQSRTIHRTWSWPLAVLVLAYAMPLVVVPPTLPIPLIDDWNYQLSVRRLVEDGELWVAPWTAASLLLQIAWGALFASIFGVDPVVLRSSSLVASFGASLACLALFRELGATRWRATLGALVLWFNPLTLVLSYTFMTDIPYLALFSLALFATVRAVRRESIGWLASASLVAGLAFLVRQQGALLPLATLGWFVAARPAWFRANKGQVIEATLGPCLVAVAMYVWWSRSYGTPSAQGDYLDSISDAGLGGSLDLIWKLVVVAIFYVGLFVFPLVLGSLSDLPGAWRRMGPLSRHVAVFGAIGLLIWVRWVSLWFGGRTFPFVPWGSILHEDGLGVLDADGLRPFFFGAWVYATIAVITAASAIAAFILIAGSRASGEHSDRGSGYWRSFGGLLTVLALGQFAGAIPPSIHIRDFITFDRYYLPLLPIAIGLVLWSMRDRMLHPLPVVAGLVLFAVVGTVGLQDWFAFKQAQWDTAEWLTSEVGVALRQVDGAAQWDGMHFYEQHLANPTDWAPRRPDDPWWLWLVAPMIDPVYVVAASPGTRAGYEVYTKRHYDSWIRPDDKEWVYVWRLTSARTPVVPRDDPASRDSREPG